MAVDNIRHDDRTSIHGCSGREWAGDAMSGRGFDSNEEASETTNLDANSSQRPEVSRTEAPAVAMAQSIMRGGVRDPAEYARLLREHPAASDSLIAWLQRT